MDYFKTSTLSIEMNPNNSRRKQIQATGTTEGIQNLQQIILDETARRCGQCTFKHASLNETKVLGFNGMNFTIAHERSNLSIVPASSQGLLGVGAWNTAIEKFYNDIVEPLSDRVGGVTTSLSYQSENGAPAQS
jgi:hypothetical protein